MGRRILLGVAALLLGAVVAVVSLSFVPSTSADLGPGTVSLRARCCTGGETRVLVPPVGSVSAGTHRSAIDLEARIDEVDVQEVQVLGGSDAPDQALVAAIEDDLPALLRSFLARSLAIGALAGALAGIVVVAVRRHGRRWPWPVLGALGGAAGVALVFGLTWSSYDQEAFAEPRFEGTLSEAPRVIDAASRYVDGLDAVEDRIEVIGAQIGQLYETSVTEALARPDPDEVRVLHISDVHLNPLGIEVAEDLAQRFDVDVVLDTGDLTTFGFPAESRFGDALDFDVPYLFVPGNHDSDDNRAALAEEDGVTLLDGDVFALEDDDGEEVLTILGVGDPVFTAANDVEDDEVRATIAAQAEQNLELVRAAQPDVLAVHDPNQADGIAGEVPLVLAGHLHERREREEDGTLLLVVGSTGATGVGSFTTEEGEPYEAQVLRFVDGELIGVDYLTLNGVAGEFTIDRTLR